MIIFGKPVEQDYHNIQALIKTDLSKDELGEEKRNAWKPVLYQGKQQLKISIHEKISAIQYDKDLIKDTYDISGVIKCRADIELDPTLLLLFTRHDQPVLPSVNDLKLHPSVQNFNIKKNALDLQCIPPLGPFTLCKYIIEDHVKIPIRGFYQMKEISPYHIKILIQLKLQENVNNHFEYFQVEIPFPNRTEINALELNPTIGSVSLHPKKKNIVIWNIGHKVGSKNLELSLPGSIFFNPTSSDLQLTEDPFLKGHNAHIKLHFHILEWTISGLHLSSKNITVKPKNTGLKNIEIDKSVKSDQYIIWNSLGDVRHCESPE